MTMLPAWLDRVDQSGVTEDRAEWRWSVVAAVCVSLAMYALLPSSFWPAVRWGVVAVGTALLIPLIIVNPMRLRTQTKLSRALSVSLTVVLAVANLAALVQLIIFLIGAEADQAGPLLLAAAEVWVTHVIAFALIYWEMDRGGPVTRTQAPREKLPPADIRFPQDEDAESVREVAIRAAVHTDWTANYIDYLYFSAANTMAFSPPDAVPLSKRAKALVGLQAMGAYVLLVLVIARAVSLLG